MFSANTIHSIMVLAVAVGAQTVSLDVSGTVRDAWGNPVQGCNVSLQSVVASTTTSASGGYRISGNFNPVALPRIFGNGSESRGLERSAFRGGAGIRYGFGGKAVDSRGRTVSGKDDNLSAWPGEIPSLKKFAAPGGDSVLVRCTGLLDQKLGVPADTAVVNVVVSPLWDIVVYGGTSAGIIAGVQAIRMGKSVVIVSPDRRLGGLTTGGLGETDIGNKSAIGGLSLNFYARVAAKYAQDSYWTQQTRASYTRYTTGTMWTFEPKVAVEIYNDLIRENNLPVVSAQRLDLARGVIKSGARIQRMVMESGIAFSGRMFIDATYEGDLMAEAGVSYAVGREANSQYGETYNGIQMAQATKNQLPAGIDPYVTPGVPSSGLLPGVNPNAGGTDGSADAKLQAYCFRMTLTDAPANRVAVAQPPGYDERRYEILFRAIAAGQTGNFFKLSAMPNRKTDSNNEGGISVDYIGANYNYPDGDYAVRDQIIQAHASYQKGFLWTLANHTRVPQTIRTFYSNWGLPLDEFTAEGNWSPQLYIREARRMLGEVVMTQAHVTQATRVTASVGLGAYTMDSHNTQRVVSGGQVRNEGDVQVGGFGPYPIDYGSITPRRAQCENLLVPVCLSATHIAYGSIRMEPVFMILGQSAATAAAQAIDQGVAVQQVNYTTLANRLVQDGQNLGAGGLMVDDEDAVLTGTWTQSNSSTPFVGTGYRHDGNVNQGSATAVFTAALPAAGRYEVCFHYPANANRATNVPVTLTHSGGQSPFTVNQQTAADTGFSLGTYNFGITGQVRVTNAGTNGYVIIDGVRFIQR